MDTTEGMYVLEHVDDLQVSEAIRDYRVLAGRHHAGIRGTHEVTATGRTPSEMPGLDIAELRSWQNFLDAGLRLSAKLNRELSASHSLTLEDVRLLHTLAGSATGTVRMGSLAELLLSTPSRISRQMDRLMAKKLASRTTSEKDGRFVLAAITDDGRAVLAQALLTYAATVRTYYLNQLSRPQTAAMAENCRRISAALTPAKTGGDDKPRRHRRAGSGDTPIHSVP